MMTSPHEIVRLPYDESLTLAGVTYVVQNLGRILALRDPPSSADLRGVVASAAVDLALQRWLDRERIPYSWLDDEPFTRPQRPRLVLGGRRLILQTSLVSSRRAIQRIHRDLSLALEAPAAVAASMLDSDGLSEGDLLAFALLLGLETRSLSDLQKALAAGHPIRLVAIPPVSPWIRPSQGGDLGAVTLTSISSRQEITIQGILPGHTPWSAEVVLDPASPFRSPPLHSLTALHLLALPSGPIHVGAEDPACCWQIQRADWCNLWLYGMEILILGWKTVRDFRSTRDYPSPSRPQASGNRSPRRGRMLQARRLQPFAALADRLRQS